MSPIGPDNIREYLTAFADGELRAAENLAVLDYLNAHPEGLELVRDQQRLRLAAERTFRASSPAVPEELRRQIEAMTPTLPAESMRITPTSSQRLARRRIWSISAFAALAAALVIGGMLAGRIIFQPTPPATVLTEADAVPATVVAHASLVHADCSRLTDALHSAGYPREMAGLASLVGADVKQPAADHPDLSSIGFRYVGAGPCGAPLTDTAHLLYRSTESGHSRALSVFATKYTGQFKLEQGKFYAVAGPRSPFPVFAWRTGQVIYILVADDQNDVIKARTALTLAQGL